MEQSLPAYVPSHIQEPRFIAGKIKILAHFRWTSAGSKMGKIEKHQYVTTYSLKEINSPSDEQTPFPEQLLSQDF